MLLCGPSKNVLCDMKERFWNSICRVKNALCCGRVLPGAGVPEIACIRRLTGGCFDSCISVVPENQSGQTLKKINGIDYVEELKRECISLLSRYFFIWSKQRATFCECISRGMSNTPI